MGWKTVAGSYTQSHQEEEIWRTQCLQAGGLRAKRTTWFDHKADVAERNEPFLCALAFWEAPLCPCRVYSLFPIMSKGAASAAEKWTHSRRNTQHSKWFFWVVFFSNLKWQRRRSDKRGLRSSDAWPSPRSSGGTRRCVSWLCRAPSSLLRLPSPCAVMTSKLCVGFNHRYSARFASYVGGILSLTMWHKAENSRRVFSSSFYFLLKDTDTVLH